MLSKYKTGIFVREEKNRFLCTVVIDGIEQECYIPSSCRLENFLELRGKEVYLKENLNKTARTKWTVFAVKHRRNYIVLRTSEANDIIINTVSSRKFAFLGKRRNLEKEKIVEGYKTDIFIGDTKTIIEVKSIISLKDIGYFPTVYSERAVSQLKKIIELQKMGYRVAYIFVSLNPYVTRIELSKEKMHEEYAELFIKCVESGMCFRGYTAQVINMKSVLKREIPVIIE